MAEFLELAHSYTDQDIIGWLASEKLDGMRAFWDGGMTRGIPKADVLWADNTSDERYKQVQISTGLWSRLGNVIHAPNWWLDTLPNNQLLDGELFKHGHRQHLMSIVKQLTPCSQDWQGVTYCVFDSPPKWEMFAPRKLKWRQFIGYNRSKYDSQVYLDRLKTLPESEVIQRVEQTKIESITHLETMLVDVLAKGGEGLMIRQPMALWQPKRNNYLLKYKPFDDAEGIVTGFISGKGKFQGMLGALILDYNGQRLELSGFTDFERRLNYIQETTAFNLPGREMLFDETPQFKRGDVITFKYRGVSADGVPQEARYWRPRD